MPTRVHRKSILNFVVACCLPQLLNAQSATAADFDPFATEQPPEYQGIPKEQKAKSPPNSNNNINSNSNNKLPTGDANSGANSTEPRATPANNQKPQATPVPIKKAEPAITGTGSTAKGKSTNPPNATPIPPPSTGPLKLDVAMENLNNVNFNKAAFKSAEYTNDSLLLPFLETSTLLRSQIKLASGNAFSLSARPYFEVRHQQSFLKSGKRQPTTSFSPELGETFATVNFSNRFAVTFGQENFQWGATEFASPSNWVYRATQIAETITRSPQSKVETRQTARLNFSLGESFSLVTIAEYEAQKRMLPSIYEGRRFMLKPEYSWNSGSDFFGVVLGGAERQRFPFIGEYFSLGIGESLSIYMDAGHMKGSDILVPVEVVSQVSGKKMSNTIFAQSRLSNENIYHELLFGMKYTLDIGTEVKMEAYSNSAGYSQAEMRLAEQIYKKESLLFPFFFTPGVEARAQKGIFMSIRHANFGSKKNWTVLGRFWKPVLDSSGGGFAYVENGFNDNIVFYFAAGGFHGPLVSESSLPQRFVISLGQKYVW